MHARVTLMTMVLLVSCALLPATESTQGPTLEATATTGATPLPTPTPSPLTPTTTPDATAPFSPHPTVQPTTATPTPIEPFAWSEPVLILGSDEAFDFREIDVITDGHGDLHVVAGSREGIVYLSNRGAAWQSQLITRAAARGYDGAPSIDVDDGGRLIVAYERWAGWQCEHGACAPTDSMGIAVVEQERRGWAAPKVIPSGSHVDPGSDPGVVKNYMGTYLLYVDRYGLKDAYLTFDEEVIGEVDEFGFHPALYFDSDGLPVYLYLRRDPTDPRVTVVFRDQDPDSWPEPLEGGIVDSSERVSSDSEHASGVVHVAIGNGYRTVSSAGWSSEASIFPAETGVIAGDIAVDARGHAHLVSDLSNDAQSVDGLYYAIGGPMAFAAWAISDNDLSVKPGGPVPTQAIAVDADLVPHVVFTALTDQGISIWYTTPLLD